MHSKFKKGYYVKGQFVALGSDMDLALKAELKGTQASSKTDLKRASEHLQSLGESMLSLRAQTLTEFALPDVLHDALQEATRIHNFEARRRHMQYIGKLMRRLSDEQIQAIEQVLTHLHSPALRTKNTNASHEIEHWFEELVQNDVKMSNDAIQLWFNEYPQSNIQQLRSLIRQIIKNTTKNIDNPIATDVKQSENTEKYTKSRAHKQLYQFIQATLQSNQSKPNNGSGSADSV